jgi:hypothetical protein
MRPTRPRIKIDCANEKQQQFTQPNPEMLVAGSRSKKIGRDGREEVVNGLCLRPYMLTYHTEFDPEDGCIIYVRNVGYSTHIHMPQRPKSRMTLIINQHESLKLVSGNSCSLVHK